MKYFLIAFISFLLILLRYIQVSWDREAHNLHHIDDRKYFLDDNELKKNLNDPAYMDFNQTREMYPIPRIIHQTWKDNSIPDVWRRAYLTCQRMNIKTQSNGPGELANLIKLSIDELNSKLGNPANENFIYFLWTDDLIKDFLSLHYPWFIPTYLSYPYQIQRVDAARYFILYHFGGIYLDLDIGCERSLHALVSVPYVGLIVPLTNPVGYSNDFMVSKPGHPLLLQMIYQLPNWNHYFLIRYLTVFVSTGPAFLSYQIGVYTRKHSTIPQLSNTKPSLLSDWVSTFPHQFYGGQHRKAFFKHYTGNSWTCAYKNS